mgnify:CR=1 FL=1
MKIISRLLVAGLLSTAAIAPAQAEVVILEEFPGEWAILQSAPASAARTPGGFARFNLSAPAGARIEVLYKVRYTL